MFKCMNCIKNFVLGIFVQDESVGLKSIEKIKTARKNFSAKNNEDIKFYDIMK